MNEALPPDLPGGVATALETLRHALADPLSAAGLKLELLERRLEAVPPNGSALVDRVRGAKADLAAAGRLIDLLPRLGSIAGEAPARSSLEDLCRVAGVPLEEDAKLVPSLFLRRLASIDALRSVVALLRSQDPGGSPPRIRAETASGLVSLRIEAGAASGGSVKSVESVEGAASVGYGEANPERLFRLPRGEERAEELFLARASIESDGGRLELADREGRLVALLSWPRPAPAGDAGTLA